MKHAAVMRFCRNAVTAIVIPTNQNPNTNNKDEVSRPNFSPLIDVPKDASDELLKQRHRTLQYSRDSESLTPCGSRNRRPELLREALLEFTRDGQSSKKPVASGAVREGSKY